MGCFFVVLRRLERVREKTEETGRTFALRCTSIANIRSDHLGGGYDAGGSLIWLLFVVFLLRRNAPNLRS